MFDAERLLGRMISGGLRRSTRRIGAGTMAMGLLGLAFAAAEHLGQKKTPPPPPSPRTGPPPPPPPPPGPARQEQARVLVRAMVAAAAADGAIDDEERARILAHLAANGASAEERAFVEREMAAPARPEAIAASAEAMAAEQIYAASLLAIDVDTESERQYLDRLARALGLEASTRRRIDRDLGVETSESGREEP